MSLHRITILCALAFVASGALAQAADTSAAAPAASAAAQDCVKRHDHGAERQAPTPGKGCKSAGRVAKSRTPAANAKAVDGHDHNKVHKNQ